MRVALVASSLRLAGAEKQFVYIARALSEAGVNVRIFYLGPGDHYQEVLTRLQIPLCQIFKRGRPWSMLARLIKELLRFQPEIVLASQFGDLVFAGPAGRLCHSLVLGGVRSDGFYERNTSGRRWPLLLALSHGFIANSHRAKENLVSLGVKGAKIIVLPNVIDLSHFDAQSSKAPPRIGEFDQRFTIAAVGSLLPCKRFDRFLQALALARAGQPAILGVIAGKDLGARPELERQAHALGLGPDHLRFVGEVDCVPALLTHCRALVLCSEYEGFPNVILEAMAARLPVITTQAGDAGQIVREGVTGYVVKKDDVGMIATHMLRLLKQPDLASKLGHAGRKRVEEEYSFDCLPGRLLAIFSTFARGQRRSALLRMLGSYGLQEEQRSSSDALVARTGLGAPRNALSER